MARQTKQQIMETFAELLARHPLEKITVTDLVGRCGINRNTFYYYFHDVYELTAVLLDQMLFATLTETEPIARISDLIDLVFRFAEQNRRIVHNIYRSIDHALLEKSVFRSVNSTVLRLLNRQFERANFDSKDLETLAAFYAHAITGSLLLWISEGMKIPPTDYIDRLGALIDRSPALLLQSGRLPQRRETVA